MPRRYLLTAHEPVEGDPQLAVREAGEGRSLAYTSDPGPKWDFDLAEWAGYGTFWRGALEWGAGNR